MIDQKNLFDENVVNSLQKNINKLNKKIYNESQIAKFERKANKLFTEQKLDFAFTRIEKVKDNDLININVYLLEDVKRFVKNINIYGNEITEEKVIRNQLEFVEGDSFSSRKN